jgi:hypothetical protein
VDKRDATNRRQSWANVHPDFDGHQRPISELTDAQRLQLAWEGTLLLDWARRWRIESGRALPQDLEYQRMREELSRRSA